MPKKGRVVVTQDNLRDIVGVGSMIKTDRHEGALRRPTESISSRRLDEVTSADMGKGGKESPMNNPGFGMGGGEKKG